MTVSVTALEVPATAPKTVSETVLETVPAKVPVTAPETNPETVTVTTPVTTPVTGPEPGTPESSPEERTKVCLPETDSIMTVPEPRTHEWETQDFLEGVESTASSSRSNPCPLKRVPAAAVCLPL